VLKIYHESLTPCGIKGRKESMNNKELSKSNFDLWLLIGKVNHSIVLVRQRELLQYHVPVRQLLVLRTIKELGSNATLAEIAKQSDREIHVISRQAVSMEKDGLIRRIKDTPKSNLLRLVLTEKGLGILKISRKSRSIDSILSFLSAEERQQMESVLNRILVKLNEYAPK
jgi:DNA-binding MarR family transcriptional regulator